MPLKVYDTLTREMQEFKPIHSNRVNMFVCGPTVYDLSHLGHARTYIAYDIIARYLRHKGYSLFLLMNITDVDDKIINRSKERGISPHDLTREYARAFMEDMSLLRVNSVNLYVKASEHIPEIISLISTLIERGYGYVVDGDVYYNILKFPDYGKLSHQRMDELKKHRIEPDSRKRNPEDFSLWKSQKLGEVSWDSPWGKGRPGWHIEDTAMTSTYFGPQYDIHGGAIELVFPHHEAEIAQGEAATGRAPLVKYWIHTGVLNVNGRKMSKSLGNVITIREALETCDPETLRLFFASSHYRSPIDFSEENVEQAGETLRHLRLTHSRLQEKLRNAEGKATTEEGVFLRTVEEFRKNFFDSMDDDFNTPKALAHLIGFATGVDSQIASGMSKNTVRQALLALEECTSIFGLLTTEERENTKRADGLVRIVVSLREEARKKNDWETADRIREELSEVGIFLEDTPSGTRWVPS